MNKKGNNSKLKETNNNLDQKTDEQIIKEHIGKEGNTTTLDLSSLNLSPEDEDRIVGKFLASL